MVDTAIYIGRFEPVHNGHMALLQRALDSAQQVIVVVGSAWQARSPKNPFTWQEREAMLRDALPPADRSRVRVLPVRDYYNEAVWVQAVRQGVAQHTQPGARFALVGHFKDATSSYLRAFPSWALIDLPRQGSMDATTIRDALRDAMAEEMRRDDKVFLIGEEVAQYQGAYKVSRELLQEFGDQRVVDTPITEHGFAGLGVGAAMAGLKPIVEFMTFNFAMQAIDQIINSAAKTLYMSGGQMGAPIVFRGPNGAAARVGAQHSQDYAAWYSQIPGLKVVMPYTAADAKGLLKAAIRDPNPVIFLENEILYGHSFEVPKMDDFVLPIGKARIHKTGKDATIVSFGIGMTYSVKAVEELAKEGIDVELIDLRTIRPMDLPTVIESVKKTGRLVTVEEGYPQSSVGTEIATRVMQQAFDYLDAPILTIAGKDVPMPYAANLEKLALPSVAEVVQAVKTVCYK